MAARQGPRKKFPKIVSAMKCRVLEENIILESVQYLRLGGKSMGTKRKAASAGLANGTTNGKIRRVDAALKQSHVQIIAGSYDKILHGIIASIPSQILKPSTNISGNKVHRSGKETVAEGNGTQDSSAKKDAEQDLDITFSDSFLMNAHSAAIRSLALSPLPSPSDVAQKVILATGANDERINLYSLSTTPPTNLLPQSARGPLVAPIPSLSGVKVSQNAANKELGTLDHHNGAITRMLFPSKGKLLTSSEDNTISILRTRDWTLLSTIKAPIPKPVGRPSGDTAAPGEVPAGVNDFAVHPSMKLMISVSRGEKNMRLWNLVTGKKAGVLAFEREVLQAVGEGKYGTGEGRKIVWDKSGEEFVVAFERGCVVFDIDCKVKCVCVTKERTKVHQVGYVEGMEGSLAVSTEDGRVVFFEMGAVGLDEGKDAKEGKSKKGLPLARMFAQLGGQTLGVSSRVKDFVILASNDNDSEASDKLTGTASPSRVVVTGSSDGTIRLWSLSIGELELALDIASKASEEASKNVPQVGHLLAQYDTGNRITCLTGFVMNEKASNVDAGEESEFGGFSEGPEEDSDEDSESDSD